MSAPDLFVNLTAEVEVVAEVENLRTLQTDVLIHLIVRTDDELVLVDSFIVIPSD